MEGRVFGVIPFCAQAPALSEAEGVGFHNLMHHENSRRTSKIFRKTGGTFSREKFSFPCHADTLFPVVQVFPDHGKFFYSLHRIAR